VGLILRDVDVAGASLDVRIERGAVVSIGPEEVPGPSDDVVDGRGGALVPGLHDHHLHVLALAAARRSTDVGPDAALTGAAFVNMLREAAGQGSVRAVGYDDRTFGLLDRDSLDAIVRHVPLRVLHRTGGLWMLNSSALAAIDEGRLSDPRFERDAGGRLTGRVWRGDELVRGATPPEPDDVRSLGADLAAAGVTSVTDATASNDAWAVGLLSALPQRVRVMGPLELELEESHRLVLGEVKILLDDESLPDINDLVDVVRAAHMRARSVAVHCVTLVQLRFAIEVLREAGVRADRIEHASVAPTDAIRDLRLLGLAVVTQPAFVSDRGDRYLRDVDPRDIDALYPIASLLSAGVQVRGSSDAPYGPVDPWEAMRAAVHRQTENGTVVGLPERITSAQALALFADFAAIAVGAAADLVLLSVSYDEALGRLCRDDVVLTIVAGEIVHDTR
jgi:predicted amidohydrolase YtcJ